VAANNEVPGSLLLSTNSLVENFMIFVLLKFNVTFLVLNTFVHTIKTSSMQFSECNNISIVSEEYGFRFKVASCEQDNQHTKAKAED
jgi:hypothetical protein